MEDLIEDAKLRPILDSRGRITLEAELSSSGIVARASAPSGKSRGRREVVAFPEGGWRTALSVFSETVREAILGHEVHDQEGFDSLLREIDGTPNFAKIGGSTAIALSMALAKLGASLSEMPLYRYLGGIGPKGLPRPVGNVIGGGAHTIGGPSIQEFLVIPEEESFLASAMRAAEVHARIPDLIRGRKGPIHLGVNDERAWAAPIDDREALSILREAAGEMKIGVDAAASQFFDGKRYEFMGKRLDPEDYVVELGSLVEEFGVFYLEDPAAEDDIDSFRAIVRAHPRVLVVGDDLFTTSPARIRELGPEGVARAVLIKPNQIGTVTDTLSAVAEGRRWGMEPVVSHRSGETCEEFIAHLAVAVGARFIKTGVVGGERTAKLNELIRIEEGLGAKS